MVRVVLVTCMMVATVAPADAGADSRAPHGMIPWSGTDGTTFLVAVPAEALAEFSAQRAALLAKDRDRLGRTSAAILTTLSASFLRTLVPRVDRYADWVYSWVESYVAAFQIVVAGTRGWVGYPLDGPRAAYRAAMQQVAQKRFESMVLEPTEPGAKLADAIARLQSVMSDSWTEVVALDRERWSDFVARQVAAGATVQRLSGSTGYLCAAPPPVVAGLAADPASSAAPKVAVPTDLYFWRVARPFATRATALTLRVAFGGLWLTGGGIGAGAATGSSALSFGLATAAVWTVDYALNVADAMLHRATFERDLIGAMALAVAARTAAVQGSVDRKLDDAFDGLERCPPVGPRATGLVSQ